jgi:subtilisin family serine protease
VKPAWSWQFDPATLQRIRQSLPTAITRDWAWEGSTGAGVKVAVIDSGVDATHPAVGRLAGGAVVVADPAAPSGARVVEGPHEDLFGHGTACAAIIRKAAPDAELYSVRVLGKRLTGRGVALAEGMRWAIAHDMRVVNMSLSTARADYYGLLHELVDEAYFKGTMMVCAVNNVRAPTYPSQYASVFSVAAHTGSNPFHFDYNTMPPVEFGAPGIDIDVEWLGGNTIRSTGNSFASPHIAGLIARILGKHPTLTPFQMKTVLMALADNASGDPYADAASSPSASRM